MKFCQTMMFTVICFSSVNISWAQTVAELESQTALDNAQAERINAQAAILNAQNTLRTSQLTQLFGAEAASGNQGLINFQSNSETHFAQRLVNKSLHEATKEIVSEICTNENKSKELIFAEPVSYARVKRQADRVAMEVTDLNYRLESLKNIINSLDIETLEPFRASNSTTGGTTDDITTSPLFGITSTPLAASSALPLIAGQFNNVASLLRTDVSLSAASIDVTEATLIRSIKSELIQNTECPTILNPDLAQKTLPLITRIEQLSRLRSELEKIWIVKNGELLGRRPLANVTTRPNRADYDAIISLLSSQISAMNTAYSTLYTGLFTVNGVGISTIDTFYAANAVDSKTLFLSLTTEQASAIAVESKKPLKSERVSYAGLVTISYELQNQTGNYLSVGFKNSSNCSKIKKSDGFFLPTAENSVDCVSQNANRDGQ